MKKTTGQKRLKTLTGRGARVKITQKNFSLPPINKGTILEGSHAGKARKFRVIPIAPPHGSAHGSFRIWEYVTEQNDKGEDQVVQVPVGFSLSVPSFWDCCRVSSEASSKAIVRTHTYLFKEKIMTVKKKAKEQKQDVKAATKAVRSEAKPEAKKQYLELPAEGGKKTAMNDDPHQTGGDGKVYRPFIAVVVKGTNGKWLYGWAEDEAKLEKQKGTFDTAADASEAAAKDHDIIINTAHAREVKHTVRTSLSSQLADAARSSGNPTREAKKKTSSLSDGVSLKKVAADADVDPKLARRILRSKGAKPGGRWEWPKDQVEAVVKLLKEGAAALKAKKDAPKEEKKPEAKVEAPKPVEKKPEPKKAVKKVAKKPAKKKPAKKAG